MHDVLIVGGSIAGAATAIHLAKLGHTVRLVDQAHFPRRKACGEGLFSRGVAELAALGVLPEVAPHAPTVSSLRLRLGGRSAECSFAAPADRPIGVRRDLLDDALLLGACAAGVEVIQGVQATGVSFDGESFTGVHTRSGQAQAKAFIAADGMRSRLRQLTGLDRPVSLRNYRYGVTAHFRLENTTPPQIQVHGRPGYEVYVTPLGDRLLNVALLLGREEARSLSGRLPERYRSLVAASGAVPDNAQLIDEPIAAGPFPAAAIHLWRSNLVLVGDAAGFYDGINGEGMSLALVSGRLCAAAVHAYLSDGSEDHLRAYERQYRALVRDSVLIARFMLTLSLHPTLGALAIHNLARHPGTLARLVAVNQGRRKMTSLSPRDALALVTGI